jgi:hypothetical protein
MVIGGERRVTNLGDWSAEWLVIMNLWHIVSLCGSDSFLCQVFNSPTCTWFFIHYLNIQFGGLACTLFRS